MSKRKIIFLILILTTADLFGQCNNNFEINIRTITSVGVDEYFINILSREDTLKVVYKLKDSTSSKFDDDWEVKEIRQQFETITSITQSSDTVTRLINKLDTILQRYTSYSFDSIVVPVKEVPSYFQLLNTILSASTDSLENQKNNQNRLVFDGIRMKFDIIRAGSTKTVYAHSPSERSHPLLYSLLKNTLNLYRERKNNNFLLPEKTNGY